jgi:uncharacterized protein (DUF2267 family)
MSALGLDVIDRTVQATNIWLGELDTRVGWENRPRSWRLLSETLHALRDWLTVNEAAQLGAQMPILIRGLYYHGWNPARVPVRQRSLASFQERIAKAFAPDTLEDPREAITCVFEVMSWHISKGEIADVKRALPEDLRVLWPE